MTDFRRQSDKLNALHKEFADEDYKQSREDYKALLQIPAFRRILVGILKKSRVFGSISFDSADTNQTFKTIGFRELGVDIYMACNQADGAMVIKAIDERNEIERSRKQRFEVETKGNN